ncbi:putative GCN5-related N-acetyltransferase [Actinoplanes missouriensis 431]|uniref:Putative GCN5-related N-acetyltransferase n=1 Tax=Actinoplanes missouriensis (strain ATCC 14538 / DSM 43046 / CBS 188.64 / JCM 3121 / NBRC 102363 / NCIMB 12654 / NRRL B-3342 / UNCC 431) TaxID=512565 RepID=I0GZ07_ACTM4|nr:GNAT family N-acetyltransferase [Actinoplanes missouriensis]BAL85994.1 putative GCN5-related N-acetyltransferase [Actinoplanes missouriensis 431]
MRPGSGLFDGAVAVFDEYRVHYGETPDRERTRAWLAAQLGSGRLEMFAAVTGGVSAAGAGGASAAGVGGASAAGVGGVLVGMVTSAMQPASLRLGVVWHVQDLFVRPEARRAGVARALLDHVVGLAEAAGAVRVSLRTEVDNGAALRLYQAAGFLAVNGLTSLSRPLPR